MSPVYLSQHLVRRPRPVRLRRDLAGGHPGRPVHGQRRLPATGRRQRRLRWRRRDPRQHRGSSGSSTRRTPSSRSSATWSIGPFEPAGHPPARRIAYALNIATLQNEQTNAIAQMKDAGVTTVLCVCDEFSPIFITRAADQQQYQPEWLQIWWPDPWQRLAASSQWSHSMHTGGTAPNYLAGEVGATWQAAAGGAQPAGAAALPLVHQQLLAFFSALQAAGPESDAGNVPAGMVDAGQHRRRRLRPVDVRQRHPRAAVAVPTRLVRPRRAEQLRWSDAARSVVAMAVPTSGSMTGPPSALGRWSASRRDAVRVAQAIRRHARRPLPAPYCRVRSPDGEPMMDRRTFSVGAIAAVVPRVAAGQRGAAERRAPRCRPPGCRHRFPQRARPPSGSCSSTELLASSTSPKRRSVGWLPAWSP